MKVALVGSCPSSRWLAPFGDESWQMWVCGVEDTISHGVLSTLPRIDDFFEFHANMHWDENKQFDFRYLDWLQRQPFRIWMQDQSYIKRALTFPLNDCLERFGPYFFAGSSIPLMMAKAILDMEKQGDRDNQIGLFGIDLSNSKERRVARPFVQHFIWLAEQLGITVSSPKESDILYPPPIYGFCETDPKVVKLASRSAELRQSIEEMKKVRIELDADIARTEGELDMNEHHEFIHTGPALPVAKRRPEKVVQLARG